MKTRQLVGTVFDTVIKIVIIVILVMLIYKYALVAYDFGYRVFAEEPMTTEESSLAISISITDDATVMDVAKVLEEKGLIADARLFYVQELLSGSHDEMKTGIYELSSDMTTQEMIEIMAAEPAEDDEAAADGESGNGGEAESASQEDEAAGDGDNAEQDAAAGAE